MDKDDNEYWQMRANAYRPIPKLINNRIEPLSIKYLTVLWLNTFAAASAAELVVYSLDVTKTRMQVQGEEAKKSGLKPIGLLETYKKIIHMEGFRGLYAGFLTMAVRSLIFNAGRVVTYDVIRRPFFYIDDKGAQAIKVHHAFLCGCFAGCLAQLFANPFDIVKVRMQMEGRRKELGLKPRTKNFVADVARIYRRSGVIGLWRGVGPSCARACLMTAGDVASYDLCKRNLKKYFNMEEGVKLRFASSMFAGLVASVLSNPADVIKSRVMNQPNDSSGQPLYYKNTFDCAYKLLKNEGFFNFYKGTLPCWMRLGPWSVLFWLVFEQLRYLEGQTGF